MLRTFLGGTAFQSALVVIPTPFLVHRSSQLLCKKFQRIEWYTILHDEIRSTSQLMGQSTMSNRDIGFCHLSIVERSGKFIITSGKLSGLNESPRKVPVSILFVAFPLFFTVGCPFCRHLAAVGDIVTDFWKTLYGTCFQHDG